MFLKIYNLRSKATFFFDVQRSMFDVGCSSFDFIPSNLLTFSVAVITAI